MDDRIAELDRAIAAADAQVAASAAIPGVVYEDRGFHPGPPEEAFVLGGLFIVIVLLPLSIALSRRIWRRGTPVVSASLPPGVDERLNRLEAGVDSIAIEVERISEGQRFITKLMAGERAAALTPPSSRS
jgi:hypothetical protein